MAKPIMEFKGLQEAYACLHEWQDRLFLGDWIIKLRFCDSIVDESGVELEGRNELQIENKCSVIELRNLGPDTCDYIVKVCQEKVLIHELLHCKCNWLSPPPSMEGKYYDVLEHAALEQMARSLLMAKYGLARSWFVNFEEGEA